MNLTIVYSLLILGAYLIGSIPTSYLFGITLKGIDLRQQGSGNVGATNALRVLGSGIGITTLIIDIGKGFLAVFISKIIVPDISDLMLILIGMAAIFGHIFTIFLKFKGGKGVATSAGVFIALAPLATLITFIIFFTVVWISKYVSLGSLLGAVTLFTIELIINIKNSFQHYQILIFVGIIGLFIFIKHKANIKRIINGEENKISFRGKH